MGWVSALIDFATDGAESLGAAVLWDGFGEWATSSVVETAVGDLIIGAVVGGVTAAVTGGDVLKGAGIGAAVGGVGGYLLDDDGAGYGQVLKNAIGGVGREADTPAINTKLTFDPETGDVTSHAGLLNKVGAAATNSARPGVTADTLAGLASGAMKYFSDDSGETAKANNASAERIAAMKIEAEKEIEDQKAANNLALQQAKYDQTKAKLQPGVTAMPALRVAQPTVNQFAANQQQVSAPALAQVNLTPAQLARLGLLEVGI